jgi:putative cell wall-binding protein
MRVRDGGKILVGLAVAAAAVVVPVGAASAVSQTVENYDAYANGGAGTQVSTATNSFTLDGITYATDQAVDTWVATSDTGAPLSSGSTDGVLLVNQQGTQMASMTISLANGDPMKVYSFDLDAFGSTGTIALIPDGNTSNEVIEPGSISGNVDLSANPHFAGITTLQLVDVGDSGWFAPTLDNFTYVDLNSPPVLTATGGTTSFVAGDNTASTPVAVDSGITLADGDSTTAASATVSITGNFQAGQDVLAFMNTSATTYGDISASYNGTTGVLTLTSSSATATIAQWQSALRAVTYTDTAVTPNNATRVVSFAINDGLTGSNSVTKNVSVTDTDQTPIVTAPGSTASYRSSASAITIDGSITVSDLDNTTQSSGTVSVSGGFHSGDVLGFTNDGATMGNITGSYNAATGVLTLISAGDTATNAQWANALSAITFSSTSTTYANRTISFATSDGTKTSVAATDTVNVQPSATITTDSGSASFVAGDNTISTPVAVDGGVTVTDAAAATIASATVAITVGFQSGQDVLGFTNDGSTMGNVTASYNAGTGVLTLTSAGATATLAQWQSALQSITYTDTAVTPNTTTRTVSYTFVDGVGNTSNTATRNVTVTATDQSPIVTTTGGTTNYVGGTTAVTIDSSVTVSDLDNTTQSSGTVSVNGGFHFGDVLSFTNDGATMGNIIGSYNAATGVLTLTSADATATDSQWANALSAVAFSSTSTTYGNRTISFVTSDGTKTSSASTDTVDVLGPPTITTDAGSASFMAGDNTASTPVVVDSGVTVTDGAASMLASTTVAITGNFQSGEDVLSFANDGATMGNIAGSYNAATGVLTMTSAGATATLAQWQSALQSITYTDTAVTPTGATRTISFTAVDGAGNTSNTATRTVTVAATDQTPIVTTTGGTTNYVGGATAVTIDNAISVSDLDNATQSSGTVSIGAGFHSGDTLSFANTSSATFGNIVGSYNAATGVLTLTSSSGSATTAQWASALSAVTFSSGSSTTPGNRTISFATSDGTKTSSASTDTVDVLGPPTITTDAGSTSFVAGDNASSTPVAIDRTLTVTDGVASTLASATVAVTGNFHSGEDVLAFVNDGLNMGNITGSYNATTGVLTLTSAGATATVAQWQAALRAVTYTDTAVTPNNSTRTISFTAVDAAATTSNTATRTVTVTDTDQTPIVTTTGSTVQYALGSNPKVVDSGVTVSDLDNTTQAAASVSITAGFVAGDTLAFTNDGSTMGNIAGSYNAATGVLSLTSAGATATDAEWASALSAVTFDTSSATTGFRTISFSTDDGTKSSAAATDTVTVIPVPVVVPVGPPAYPGVTRVAGPDRVTTSIVASQREFPGAPSAFTANAVVLVASSDAIDGLTGAPLAAAVRAPLLYTGTDAVPANVLAEIHRVLGSSGKIYLLGGTAVISSAVDAQLQAAGYTTHRIAGADRYATAVAIADQVVGITGTPGAVFEATGLGYADALVAAPAAAHAAGVVLLTVGGKQSPATAAWLAAHAGVTRYAVGGPAAAADPSATAISGADRYATAAGVATKFFSPASQVALANGTAWPDAAVAAASSALSGAPLLLVTTDASPNAVATWLGANPLTSVTAFGGTTRISDGVLSSVASITGLPLA